MLHTGNMKVKCDVVLQKHKRDLSRFILFLSLMLVIGVLKKGKGESKVLNLMLKCTRLKQASSCVLKSCFIFFEKTGYISCLYDIASQ